MKTSVQQLQTIQKLVGKTITKDNLRSVDCFVHEKLSIFMPVGGSCGYAITPNHQHPSYMFTISYDNETSVFIDQKSIKPSPNQIFCLSPNIQHHEIQHYLPPKYCAIFIKKEFFEMSLKEYCDESLHFNGLLIKIQNHKLDYLTKSFIEVSEERHPSRDTILENFATLITHEIIRNITKYNPPAIYRSANQMINEIVQFINIDYDQDITVELLSKRAKLSKSHFSKLFSDEMNITPMEYLKTIRLQNAKKMLRSNHLSITEVSQQCGFNSPSYFTKLFNLAFNETPKAFIKREKL